VASIGQAPIDFDDPQIERGYEGSRAYGQSKLAQISWGIELAGRLEGKGVTVNSLHPSTLMPTKMVREMGRGSVDTLEAGVEATVRLVTSPEVENETGRFYDRLSESAPHAQALDADARLRLWDLSAELTGAPGPD
jgi:NAD(P)-dependent dehydrogenase (short-subunit alcohol dehydrogenase family)